MRIVRAFRDFFIDLFDGDPVAWTFVSIFVVIAVVVGIVWWRGRVEQRRWDERHRSKKPPKKDK